MDAILTRRTGAAECVERRRSPRRRLHRPTTVTLCPGGAGGPGEYKAAMLNLSTDGLACRLPWRGAEALAIGQTVGVVFRLEPAVAPFTFSGRITNLTQGGTTDRVVLGLEFLQGPDSEISRRRLQEAMAE